MNGLPGDPHDQQHYRHIGIPEALVGDINPGWPDLRCLLLYDRTIELVHWLRHTDSHFFAERVLSAIAMYRQVIT